jgi:asparagine synthase (glutamine-hydrolysing)
MCGIAGIWRREPPVEEAELQALCESLRHRGPDGGGIWVHPRRQLGFAHRRLAIIDLSDAAAQPMHSPSGRCSIVFNGEIYNYAELRQQAQQRGWCFRSRSDTEVILALYELFGIGCVELLRGMFAFALWDEQEQRLYLVRDRLGIKPLYYGWDGQQLVFASELHAVQRVRGFPLQLNVAALWDYFAHHYIPPPRSIYEHVQKLEAGTWLCFDAVHATFTVQRYWQLPDGEVARYSSAEQAAEELDELLQESARLHCVADVPLGAFLSGGVDSSAVVAYARRWAPVRAIIADFDYAHKSERRYAEAVAQRLGVPALVVPLRGEEFPQLLERFAASYDEPFGDSSGIALLAIAQVARSEFKAVLSGDGGDELFAGYIRSRRELGCGGLPLRSRRLVPFLMRRRRGLRGMRWLRALLPPALRVLHTNVWMYAGQIGTLLHPALREHLPADYDELAFARRYWKPQYSPLRMRLFLDLHTWLPERMLTKVDRASMAVGLEVRVPLLDHRLVEWVFRLPEWLLWSEQHGGKWLLKRLLSRELPPELVYRPKHGFSIPLREWLERVEWQAYVRDSKLWQAGLLHPQLFARADLRSPVTRWLLLELALWAERNPWSL